MTMPLLEGLDGVNKMSKSLDNYIGIEELPDQMFGKVMSISDDLMWRYYELLTDTSIDDVNAMKFRCESEADNPRDLKVVLAKSIIADLHSEQAAEKAEEEFTRRFVKKEIPGEIEEKTVTAGSRRLVDILTETGLASSKGEAKRLIEQGGVKVNGERASGVGADIDVTSDGVLLQVGKLKFMKVSGQE